jgi:hypothetical protein
MIGTKEETGTYEAIEDWRNPKETENGFTVSVTRFINDSATIPRDHSSMLYSTACSPPLSLRYPSQIQRQPLRKTCHLP